MKLIIENFFKKHFDKLPKSLIVAVSGGIDSMVLTFALNEFCREKKIILHAITIDHKMRKNSSFEAKEVAKIMKKHKINHEIFEIDEEKLPKKNVEANLRKERYDLIYEFAIENKIKDVFIAHHKDDLAENFLIRLFRGSRFDGLAPIAEISNFKDVKIYRPFLDLSKDDLQKYAKTNKIKWFEDKSNKDEKFLRNKIRNFLDSFEEKNLIANRIADFCEYVKEAKETEDEMALMISEKFLIKNEKDAIINVKKYCKSPKNLRRKILAKILMEIGEKPYKPRLADLIKFEEDILILKKGKKRFFYGVCAKIVNKNEIIGKNKNSNNNIFIRIFNENL